MLLAQRGSCNTSFTIFRYKHTQHIYASATEDCEVPLAQRRSATQQVDSQCNNAGMHIEIRKAECPWRSVAVATQRVADLPQQTHSNVGAPVIRNAECPWRRVAAWCADVWHRSTVSVLM